MSGDFEVRHATSAEERDAVYALRYAVYAEERALEHLVNVDHERKVLCDPLDESGLLLYAIRGDEVLGTIRLNTAARTAFSSEFRHTYRCDVYDERRTAAFGYSGRLMVHHDQ